MNHGSYGSFWFDMVCLCEIVRMRNNAHQCSVEFLTSCTSSSTAICRARHHLICRQPTKSALLWHLVASASCPDAFIDIGSSFTAGIGTHGQF